MTSFPGRRPEARGKRKTRYYLPFRFYFDNIIFPRFIASTQETGEEELFESLGSFVEGLFQVIQ
jgi:hypothetical protein